VVAGARQERYLSATVAQKLIRIGVAPVLVKTRAEPQVFLPACIPRTRVVSTDDASPARSPTARMSLRFIWPAHEFE
jgi:hypothetical protein